MKKLAALLLSGLIGLTGLNYINVNAESDSIRILFTHDLLDRVESCKTLNENGDVVIYGGYSYLSSAIKEYKNSNTAVADAGNFSSGSLYGTVNSTSAPGLTILNQIGYDVLSAGARDFDYGISRFRDMLKTVPDRPAVVQANMIFASDIGVAEYTIVDTADYRIGFFGLTDPDAQISDEAVEITNAAEAAKNASKELRENGADLVVCLYSTDSDDFDGLTAGADIDVIIAGGSHKAAEAYRSNDTWIVSSDPYGKTLGILDIDPDTKELRKFDNVEIKSDRFSADAAVSEKINSYQSEIQNTVLTRFGMTFAEPVFNTPYSLTTYDRLGTDRKYAQSADLVTDAMIEAYHPLDTDEAKPVSITAEDQITGTLFKGDVYPNDLFMLASRGMGFDGVAGENLIHVYMKGSDLLALCEMDLMCNKDLSQQFHFGRMRYEYSENRPVSNQVIDVYTEEADGYYIAATADRLYPVITTAKVLDRIPEMMKECGCSLVCNIYDEHGNPATDYELMALRSEDGAAIKQWSAITEYAKHFDRGANGTGVLNDRYKTARKQKEKITNLNLMKLFKHASKPTYEYYTKLIAIPVAVIAALYILVWLLNRKK